MSPPERKTTTLEKVKIEDFIKGVISDIEYDDNHIFKYKGEEKVSPAIRFVFELEGCHFPHRSRWMNFNTGDKANLYKKYIAKLVKNAKPDMDFDLDIFKGMKIKTIWEEQGDFQNLESIYPNQNKIEIAGNENSPSEDDDFVNEEEKE